MSTVQCIAAFAPRESARTALKRAFPRRRARLVLARTPAAFERLFRRELVDAALVDVDHAGDDTWRVAGLAREFPSAPFFGVVSYRGAGGPAIAKCADHEFADVLADGVDSAAVRDLVVRDGFTARFVRALEAPPPALNLTTTLQHRAWTAVVAHAGRPVRTGLLARGLGLTREHLSRKFAASDGPNLKRVIDLVRVLAAAELAKNPGYDVADVAVVLGFASPSHLATTARRVIGARPVSLARLRAIDLIKRFADGRGRSRA
ncbi:MAG TPA: AraC family transcriptional regulator [Gemmatimonadaceae bacterium]|nr:AraC family transcriptional regulator [Gemmatimonadaceae bacterium]